MGSVVVMVVVLGAAGRVRAQTAAPEAPEPDAATPPDRRVETRPDWKLVGAGVGGFAAAYVPSLAVASILVAASEDPEIRDSARRVMIPVAGPFLAIPGAEKRDVALAVLSGLMQAGGILAAITGLLKREKTFVYEAEGPAGHPLAFAPRLGAGSLGLSLAW